MFRPIKNLFSKAAGKRRLRVDTPVILQMEATECGAASLAMVLGYFGRIVSLEELREKCNVTRDGSTAYDLIKAGQAYGLRAKGYSKEIGELASLSLPMIVFWHFNHFLVLEGFTKDCFYLKDPASGTRVLSLEEFDQGFTGVVLTFEPGPDFVKGGKRPNLFTSLRKRLRGSGPALLYIFLVGLALVIPGLLGPIYLKLFVDSVMIGRGKDWLAPILVGMTIILFVSGGLTWLQQFHLLRLETKITLSTSSKFLLHVLRLSIDFFTQRFGGEIGSRVAINDRVAELLSGQLARSTLNLLTVIFYTILLYIYDPLLTLVGVGMAILNFAALHFVLRKMSVVNHRVLAERGKLIGNSMNGLQMIESLKAGGGESIFFARWAGYQAKQINAEQEFAVYVRSLSVIPALFTAINAAVILGVGGFRIMSGIMSVGMLIAFQALMASFSAPINQLVNLSGRLHEVEGDLQRLDDVLGHKIDYLLAAQPPVKVSAEPSKLTGQFALNKVVFGYGNNKEPLINDFNLELRPGERVALVGPSGSGKSTISKIVTGLLEPWSGEVLLDNIERGRHPRASVTASLAMVDQNIFLFEGTVRENLTMWDSSIPEEDVVRAAKDAEIHEVIAARPGGYDSVVEEEGLNFSAGERQRLEIARALSGNPRIVVLDEATSSLDPVTEKIIDGNLRSRGCTCLIIAHRLSTIRDCNEIIVLERGRVVQRGTHDELMSAEGLYSKLISTE